MNFELVGLVFVVVLCTNNDIVTSVVILKDCFPRCISILQLVFCAFAVTLRSIGSTPFRGFQVRAHRLRGDTESIVGQFRDDPSSGQRLQYYPEVIGTTVRRTFLFQI